MPHYDSVNGQMVLRENSVGNDCRNEDGSINWDKAKEFGIRQTIPWVYYDKARQDESNKNAPGVHIDQSTLDAKLAEWQAKADLKTKEAVAAAVAEKEKGMKEVVDQAIAAAFKAAGVNAGPSGMTKKKAGRPKGVPKGAPQSPAGAENKED
jgi:hypothetical protein